MVDPRSGEEVPSDEIRRGLELEPGRFVLLDEGDLSAVEPPASRSIEVLRVVPRDAIDPAWYERPYHLGPDGGREAYGALVKALGEDDHALVRWVMRGRRYVGALGASGAYLMLVSLRSAAEVVPAAEVAPPNVPEVRAAERALAEQLLAALEAPWDPAELRDEHRERLLALIEAKRRGRRFEVKKVRPPRPSGDLAQALKRSIAAAKGGRRAAA
jgi:DNA end-binding protein Ku